MKNWGEMAGMVALALGFAFVLYAKKAGGYASLNGHARVPTTGEIRLIRTEKEVDAHALVTVDIGRDRVVVPLLMRDHQLFGPRPEDIPTATVTGQPVSVSVENTRRYYIINPMLDRIDLGSWAGHDSIERDDGSTFDVGLRWGVCRFFDDIVALDLVGNDHVLGAGISLHPPADRFPGLWSHIGIGWARVVGSGNDGSGDVFAISFNTR